MARFPKHSQHAGAPHAPASRQRGAVLIVALVVLVALALAALSLLRTVDILGLVAGNLSFKRSAVAASDRGVEAAMAEFQTIANQAASSVADCYSATILPINARGIPGVLADSDTFRATYPTCQLDAGEGETVYYLIDRQCAAAGFASGSSCTLAQRKSTLTDTDGNGASLDVALFRVSVRVEGPKNTLSFTQVVFKPPL